jgi:hypothetical protein
MVLVMVHAAVLMSYQEVFFPMPDFLGIRKPVGFIYT